MTRSQYIAALRSYISSNPISGSIQDYVDALNEKDEVVTSTPTPKHTSLSEVLAAVSSNDAGAVTDILDYRRELLPMIREDIQSNDRTAMAAWFGILASYMNQDAQDAVSAILPATENVPVVTYDDSIAEANGWPVVKVADVIEASK